MSVNPGPWVRQEPEYRLLFGNGRRHPIGLSMTVHETTPDGRKRIVEKKMFDVVPRGEEEA